MWILQALVESTYSIHSIHLAHTFCSLSWWHPPNQLALFRTVLGGLLGFLCCIKGLRLSGLDRVDRIHSEFFMIVVTSLLYDVICIINSCSFVVIFVVTSLLYSLLYSLIICCCIYAVGHVAKRHVFPCFQSSTAPANFHANKYSLTTMQYHCNIMQLVITWYYLVSLVAFEPPLWKIYGCAWEAHPQGHESSWLGVFWDMATPVPWRNRFRSLVWWSPARVPWWMLLHPESRAYPRHRTASDCYRKCAKRSPCSGPSFRQVLTVLHWSFTQQAIMTMIHMKFHIHILQYHVYRNAKPYYHYLSFI